MEYRNIVIIFVRSLRLVHGMIFMTVDYINPLCYFISSCVEIF